MSESADGQITWRSLLALGVSLVAVRAAAALFSLGFGIHMVYEIGTGLL